jgi:hypothetical protein
MFTKTSLISMLLVFHSIGLNKCNDNPDAPKITVVGEAFNMKHRAGVQTDDRRKYYLDGIESWELKYVGKRVKVTGKLFPREDYTPPIPKITDTSIRMTPQPRVRDGDTIKKAKWRLVE